VRRSRRPTGLRPADSTITVAADGVADFRTLSEALEAAAALPAPRRIALGAGTFREKVRVSVPDLVIEGAGPKRTRLVWDDCALRRLPDGETMGTFNSYTLYVGAPGVTLRALSVENDAGDGRAVGQAVALYADADRFSAENCAFLARQDTICTGPLPKNPVPKGVNLLHPVAGLGDDEPALPFRQRYLDCLVAGDVDFIFGSAAALFRDCEIRSLRRGDEESYVAAPSTYPGQETGFLFHRCRLTAEDLCGPVYLCRPWRATGRCAYVECELGAHIAPAGWDDWQKPESHELGFFAEGGNTGPGATLDRRPTWVRRLGPAEYRFLTGA
jgi:pectinesterase